MPKNEEKSPPLTATDIRITRGLLDGASIEKMSQLYDISFVETTTCWDNTIQVVQQYFEEKHGPIADIACFIADNMASVLDYLLKCGEELSYQELIADSNAKLSEYDYVATPDATKESLKKDGTDQGKTE